MAAFGMAMKADLAVETLDGIGRVQRGAMGCGESHIGQHIGLGLIHQIGEFRYPGAELIGDLAPFWALAALAWSWAKAETTRRLCLPAWARTLRMKWTRQRCQVAHSTLDTAALMPLWASDIPVTLAVAVAMDKTLLGIALAMVGAGQGRDFQFHQAPYRGGRHLPQ